MARKRLAEEPEDKDRWLISYADLMTSMFAFFVVLYAVSSVQEKKFLQMSSSLGNALGNPSSPISSKLGNVSSNPLMLDNPQVTNDFIAPEPISVLIPPALELTSLSEERTPVNPVEITKVNEEQQKIEQNKTQIKNIANELEQRLAPLVNQGKVHVTLSNWGISIEINASILFGAAEAKLNPESIEILQPIADILKDQPQLIHVAGYTDNKVINNAYYPSNWELSAARASSVVRLLIDAGVDSKRLAAVGNADNQAIATNATPEGRMRNRRVQLSIMAKSTEEYTSASRNEIH
ncbi:MAG: flagellar motor protein MotD [Methylococcales bacterium]|nr:MAG: flagellar motor protein MotD [Methylococcales bacterium]